LPACSVVRGVAVVRWRGRKQIVSASLLKAEEAAIK
jgi:hypothetical protein